MKFAEIVAEAAKTAHETYFWEAPNGQEFFAPAPLTEEEQEVADRAELQRQRKREREERASELARIVEAAGLDRCEEMGINIAELIDPPVYIQKADGELPINLALIFNK